MKVDKWKTQEDRLVVNNVWHLSCNYPQAPYYSHVLQNSSSCVLRTHQIKELSKCIISYYKVSGKE